jgi:uncharacterized protein
MLFISSKMKKIQSLALLPLITILTLSSCDGDSSSITTSDENSTPIEPVYEIVNGDFETGTLQGWTILEGLAFSNSGISQQTNVNDEISFNKQGQYFYHKTSESNTGIMRSSYFTIGGTGYMTFKLGGAYNHALTYISIVRADDDIELFRFSNTEFNLPSSGYDNYRVENLVDYYADLSTKIGTEVYVLVVDQSTANYGYISLDGLFAYHPQMPDIQSRFLAEDIKPIFPEITSIPNEIPNGNFTSRTLESWTVIGEEGVFQDSHINDNGRLSNRPDETKVGVLRSSAFKVGGVNLISFRLGATKNPLLTYMSLKQVGTNEEVFRTYSNRWIDAHEENTHLYFIDLNNYINEAFYFEFVDNSRADWGLLTIEQVITYYGTLPFVTDEIAVDIRQPINLSPQYLNMRNYVDPLINGVSDETERLTFQKTFYSTIDGITNIKGSWPSVLSYENDGSTFVKTGDIPAMWLRDSAAQVLPYIQFMKIDEDVRLMIRGLLLKQFEFIRRDPYANAFNADGSVWERKFEIDSLMYPLWLAHQYYQTIKDDTIFDTFFYMTYKKVLDTLDDERNHDDANYRIGNPNTPESDRNVGSHDINTASGLIWSGYRPSDDVNHYKFYIPGNMFAVATLEKMYHLLNEINRHDDLATRGMTMASEVRNSIETYATYNHPNHGKIYAFEVTGFETNINSSNGKLLIDIANIPSLLSIPWLGFVDKDDQVYQNTRSFILSHDNPYYFEGTYASGVGDPHELLGGANAPWHMGLAMQGLTSDDPDEIRLMIDYMVATTGGTYVMHEAFNADNPTHYSRDWFTWPCALFAHLYLTEILNIHL